MTNPNTISNTNQLPDFSRMSKTELEEGFKKSSQDMNLDLAGKYMEALKNLETKNKTLDKSDVSKMDRSELLNFVTTQISEIRGSTDEAAKAKESELLWLIDKLNNEKTANENILTDNPSLLQYASLSRRRNANLLKKIEDLKQSPEYPKNVLIYAMGVTSSKYFSAWQSLKRWWAKLTRNWKSENIKANIENLITRCQPEATDSAWKKATKSALLRAVREAKDIYVRKLQLQNSF